VNGDGCSNSDDYRESWLKPGLKNIMFHASAEECCEAVFSGRSCKLYDQGCQSTDKPAPDASAPTPSTPASTDDNCSEHGWHVDVVNGDGCSNSDDYRESWLKPGLKNIMFHASAEECCKAVFSGRSCKHHSHGCNDGATPASTDKPAPTPSKPASTNKPVSDNPAPTPPSREGCSELGWHVHMKNNDGCTNDDKVSPGWLKHSMSDLMFYQTAEACCDRFFRGRECNIYNAGCDDSTPASPTLAAPTGAPASPTLAAPTGKLVFDWEDKWEDMKHFTFTGFGKWTVGPHKDSLAVHSPRGLLPGEHSSLEINMTAPDGGQVSFHVFLGIGKISFFIDSVLEFTEDKPGQGTQEIEAIISPGEHLFSWRYEPPAHANMPLSMVWIDNIEFKI